MRTKKKSNKRIIRKELKRMRRRKKILEMFIVIIIAGAGIMIYGNSQKNSVPVSDEHYEHYTYDDFEDETFEDKVNKEDLQSVQVENINNTDKFENVDITNDNKGVPVLCYHSVGYDESGTSPLIISPEKFREHMKGLKENGYTTLTMADLLKYLINNKPIPVKSVVITFDDGYKDNYINAFPILKEFGMTATIFVVSDLINGETSMTDSEIKEMSDYGIDIESHTVSHNRLSEMSYSDQLYELSQSKLEIEKITGKHVIAAAYPEGKYTDDTKTAVREAGYEMGFTIEHGYADRNDDLCMLNRVCIDYTFSWSNVNYILNNIEK